MTATAKILVLVGSTFGPRDEMIDVDRLYLLALGKTIDAPREELQMVVSPATPLGVVSAFRRARPALATYALVRRYSWRSD